MKRISFKNITLLLFSTFIALCLMEAVLTWFGYPEDSWKGRYYIPEDVECMWDVAQHKAMIRELQKSKTGKKRVFLIGDSISEFWGWQCKRSNAINEVIPGTEKDSIAVYNFGTQGLNLIQVVNYIETNLEPLDPSFIVISICLNDIGREYDFFVQIKKDAAFDSAFKPFHTTKLAILLKKFYLKNPLELDIFNDAEHDACTSSHFRKDDKLPEGITRHTDLSLLRRVETLKRRFGISELEKKGDCSSMKVTMDFSCLDYGDPELFYWHIEEPLRRLNKMKIKDRIILAIFPYGVGKDEYYPEPIHKKIAGAIKAQGLRYIDLLPVYKEKCGKPPCYSSPDNVHPNEEGYIIFYREIFNKMLRQ